MKVYRRWALNVIVFAVIILVIVAFDVANVHAEAQLITQTSNSSSSSFAAKKTMSTGDYSGIGQLIQVTDNSWSVNEGWLDTRTETASRSQSGSAACGTSVSSNIPESISYNSGGYTGTLSKTSSSYSDTTEGNCEDGKGTYSFSRSADYSGTVSKWIENWVTYSSYDAAYRAYVYTQETIVRALGQADNCVCKIDPVNLINGNFLMSETDITIMNRAKPLEINRHYNSQDHGIGLFGEGWRFEFETSIDVNSKPGTAIVTYAHGRKVYFKEQSGSSVYKATKTVFDVLTKNSNSTYTLRMKDNTVYNYNAQGKLTSIVDSNLNITQLEYNSSGILEAIHPAGGVSVEITVQQGKISMIRDETGRQITYTYNAAGRLHSVQGLGGTRTYSYNQHGITSIQDENGNFEVRNVYDQFGRVIGQTDAEGNESEILYDELNRINTVTTFSNGKTLRYAYNDDLFVTREIQEDGTYLEYTYDNNGNIATVRDRQGRITSNTYDNKGNLISITSPAPYNYVTLFDYDANNRLTSIELPDGGHVEFSYNSAGNLLQKKVKLDGAQYAITQFTYDSYGRLLTVTDPEDRTITLAYGVGSGPVSITDEENGFKAFQYDSLGRQISTTTIDGTTTLAYNNMDLITQIIDPENDKTRIKYDALGNIVKRIMPEMYNPSTDDGTGVSYTYNKLNQMIRESDELGHTSAYAYNQDGHVTKEVKPNEYNAVIENAIGTSYEYDHEGRIIRVTNPSGEQTRFVYDAVGNLIKVIDANHYNELTDSGAGTTFSYDTLNRLVETRDHNGNVTKRYVYDQMGRVVKEIDALGYLSGNNDNNRIGTVLLYNLAGWLLEFREPLRHSQNSTVYRLTRYVYDKSGKMIEKHTSPDEVSINGEPLNWNIVTYEYDKRGNITMISDTSGAEITYTYDALGRTIEEKYKINAQSDQITGYQYNSKGLLEKQWQVIHGEDIGSNESVVNAETSYEYDKNGRMTQMTSPNGDLTEYEYDLAGRLVKVEKQVQVDQLFENHVRARVTSPRQVIYPNQNYDLKVEIDPDEAVKGFSLNISYDARLFEVVSVTPILTGVTSNSPTIGLITLSASSINMNSTTQIATIILKAKDNLRGVASVLIQPDSSYKNSDNLTLPFTEAIGQSFTVQEPDMNRDGNVETNDLTFAALNNNLTQSNLLYDHKFDINNDGSIGKQDFDYISNWLFDNKSNDTTTVSNLKYDQINTALQYDVAHHQTTRVNRFNYDRTGNLLKETDSEGREVKYTYDTYNRVTSVTQKDNAKTIYVYDEMDRVVKEIRPQHANGGPTGIGTSYAYDDMGRLVTITGENGVVLQRNVYDVQGRLVKQIEASGYLSATNDNQRYGIVYTYDFGNRLISVKTPEAQTNNITSIQYAYNALDQIVSITDGEGNITVYERDMWGRATRITDGEGHHSDFTYDYAGNVTSSRDGNGKMTVYTYNSMNLLAAITDPLSQTILYKYDPLGRVISMQDRNGQDIKYTYNSDDQPTSRIIEQTGEKEEYLYSRDGSLLAAINDKFIDRYSYTPNGYLAQQTRNGKSYTAYNYDLDGRITSMEDASGSMVGYTYDTIGRLQSVMDNGNMTATYNYNMNNSIAKVLHANGNQLSFEYDRDGNIISVIGKNAQNSVLDSHSYTYDNNGHVLTDVGNGELTTYTYDRNKQLTAVQYPTGILETLQYDAAGNRTHRTLDGVLTNYSYDANNRLIESRIADNITSYSYDANGNLLQEVDANFTNTYLYNGFNQLIEADRGNGNWMRYTYDPEGLRASISENGIYTGFIYDNSPINQVIAEKTASGHGLARYIRGYDLLATTDPQGRSYSYLSNIHGDITGIVNSSGSLVNKYTYDAFGNTIQDGIQIHNRFMYAGEQYDALTDNYYLRARYYSPSIGRFTQEDTYRGDGLNLYAYVQNNPINFVDPTGYMKFCQTDDLIYGIKDSLQGTVKSLLDINTYIGMWELSKAVANKELSLEELLTAMADAATEPFRYIINNTDYIFLENPTDKEVRKYGEKFGDVLQSIATGAGGTVKTMLLDVAPKLARLFDNLADAGKKVPDALSCNCFTAGTKVLTDEGEKPIEEIEVGDKVLAKSEFDENGELAYKEVTALYTNYRNDIIKLYIGDLLIETTDNHPFWVEEKGWVFADELKAGDKLQKADGSNLTIDRVEFVLLDEPVMVYNFTVEEYHTYYVTDLGIWVHNTECFNINIKPTVSNSKLQNVVKDLYKGQNMPSLIGNGTTMDAIRHELNTGQAVGDKFHSQKGQDYSRALEKLINNGNLNAQDKAVAQALYDDLKNALAGK